MKLSAKQRGQWPETIPTHHLSPTVAVTFNIDRGLYDWLANFVGGYSFFFNVEEALTTAVRCMAGAEHRYGCDILSLACWVSDAKGQPTATALYRSTSPTADHDKIRALHCAARIAAMGNNVAEWDLSDDPDLATAVKAILAAVQIELDLESLNPRSDGDEQGEDIDTTAPYIEAQYDDDISF